MGRHWWRWRAYMDEIEEAMRSCAAHLDEVETLCARRHERGRWPARQEACADAELVRRAFDMPWLRTLVRTAARIGDLEALSAPDFSGRRWSEGETDTLRRSIDRVPPLDEAGPQRPAAPHETPPARLRAAERALAERTRSLVVVLDDLVSARNASAVVRSTDAFGLQEIHFIQREGRVRLERTVTTLSERWLDLHWHREPTDAIEGLRARGYHILAADFGDDAVSVEHCPLSEKVALVFGSEQRGVSDAVRESADGFFYLPTTGFTAYLNVAVATGIALYTLDRRMREAGLRTPLSERERAALRPVWYAGLAGGSRERATRYRAWTGRPPEPAPVERPSDRRSRRD